MQPRALNLDIGLSDPALVRHATHAKHTNLQAPAETSHGSAPAATPRRLHRPRRRPPGQNPVPIPELKGTYVLVVWTVAARDHSALRERPRNVHSSHRW